jgi:hypothetical protein
LLANARHIGFHFASPNLRRLFLKSPQHILPDMQDAQDFNLISYCPVKDSMCFLVLSASKIWANIITVSAKLGLFSNFLKTVQRALGCIYHVAFHPTGGACNGQSQPGRLRP